MRHIGLMVYEVAGRIVERLARLLLRIPFLSASFAKHQMIERLWLSQKVRSSGSLWVHAASVGEAMLALAYLHHFAERLPAVHLSVQTVAALALVRQRSPHMRVSLAPLDSPGAVNRAFDALQPEALWILETELWPGILATAHARGVPVLSLNSSVSLKSTRLYRLFGILFAPLLSPVWFFARSSEDAHRLRTLGARPDHIWVQGDAKVFLSVPFPALPEVQGLTDWLASGPVVLAASTHAAEEDLVLTAFRALENLFPSARLVLAPRHPERASREAWAEGLRLRSNPSSNRADMASERVFVLDTLGELRAFYAHATVVIAGGTFVSVGGHNLMEASHGTASLLVGPHCGEIAHQVALLESAGRCRRVDSGSLADAVAQSLQRATSGSAVEDVSPGSPLIDRENSLEQGPWLADLESRLMAWWQEQVASSASHSVTSEQELPREGG